TGTAYLNAFPVNYIPLRDETFKNIWMYTESQSSDKMSIVPYINSSFMGETVYGNNPSNSVIPAFKAEFNWRINKFRDILLAAFGSTPTTKAWVDIQGEFNQLNGYQGYIDQLPRASAHNASVNPWNKARFSDKFLFVRMFFNSPENLRITTNTVESFKRPSIR